MLCLVLRPDVDPLAALGRRAAALLRRLGLPDEVVEREAVELRRVRVGKTKNRRVLGSMNDAVLQIEGHLFDYPRPPATLEQCEDVLVDNLYSMLDHEPPREVARALLGAPPAPRPTPRGVAFDIRTVPVTLSDRDRELVLEHGLLDGRLMHQLAARAWCREQDMGFGLTELDELPGRIARETERLERQRVELERLHERLQAVLEAAVDEGG